METKPYSLQSPEQIAKDYGGNKQKIAEAMQMGILDPTAGTLAAMFIDRMRSAAQTEAAPQQSVAQQVFAPPMPQMPQGMPPMPQGAPAGLGATPQAAAMPMPTAAPPMGMPAPQAAPGMAAGGLTALPLPDDMFDEPSNGGFDDGYRSGGLVAFNPGGPVKDPKTPRDGVDPNGIVVTADREEDEDLSPSLQRGMLFDAPSEMAGFKSDIFGNLDTFNEESPREVKRAEQYQAYLDRMLSPEEQKKRRQEDMWMALGQIGARMATTPGSLLQAASAGIGEALPGIAAAAKERRAEERATTKELLGEERLSNKEKAERFQIALDMVVKGYIPLEQAFQDRNFRERWERLGRESQERIANINAAAGITQTGMSVAGQRDVARMGLDERRGAFFANALADYKQGAALDPEYQRLFKLSPTLAQDYLVGKATTAMQSAFGGGSFGTPALPPGYKPDKP